MRQQMTRHLNHHTEYEVRSVFTVPFSQLPHPYGVLLTRRVSSTSKHSLACNRYPWAAFHIHTSCTACPLVGPDTCPVPPSYQMFRISKFLTLLHLFGGQKEVFHIRPSAQRDLHKLQSQLYQTKPGGDGHRVLIGSFAPPRKLESQPAALSVSGLRLGDALHKMYNGNMISYHSMETRVGGSNFPLVYHRTSTMSLASATCQRHNRDQVDETP
jgi:hypothetical protein